MCKKPSKVPGAPLGSLRVGAPGYCVALAISQELKEGTNIFFYLPTIYTNVEIVTVNDITAEVFAVKLLNEVIAKWGYLLSIHSDQGKTYASRVFQDLCRMLDIRKTRTSYA